MFYRYFSMSSIFKDDGKIDKRLVKTLGNVDFDNVNVTVEIDGK